MELQKEKKVGANHYITVRENGSVLSFPYFLNDFQTFLFSFIQWMEVMVTLTTNVLFFSISKKKFIKMPPFPGQEKKKEVKEKE